jgi:hypothetical protein
MQTCFRTIHQGKVDVERQKERGLVLLVLQDPKEKCVSLRMTQGKAKGKGKQANEVVRGNVSM